MSNKTPKIPNTKPTYPTGTTGKSYNQKDQIITGMDTRANSPLPPTRPTYPGQTVQLGEMYNASKPENPD